MAYVRDRVIVLKKEPFREQDRRYTMYGKEHGLLIAVARGSSTKNSKQAGHLEPFSETDVMIAKGTAFDKLAVAKQVRSFFAHGEAKLGAYTVCGIFCDLVVRLLRQGISDERLYGLLIELFETASSFSTDPSPARAQLLLSAATLHLLDLLGFAPTQPPGEGDVARLIAFIRRVPLADVIRVTAPTSVIHATAVFIEEGLEHTPLHEDPRLSDRLHAFLGH
jgi:DNA repair protein RecO